MSVLTDRHYFLIAVALYGVSTVYSVLLWRHGFREDNRINYLLLLAGAGVHTLAMALRGFSFSRCPVTNLYEATLFIGWTIAATYLVLGLYPRVRFLGAFVSPFLFGLGVFALMPALDTHGPQPQFTGGLSSLHASLSLLAYGAFGLASAAGVMYLCQEHDLKFRKLRAVFSLVPPIQRLERVIQQSLGVGLALLTLGLLLGFGWLKREKGVYFTADAKLLWSILVWALYGGLLIMRWRFAPSGRRVALGAIGSFAFVVLTFWGTNLLSPLHTP